MKKTITYDDSLYCLVPIEPSENMLNRGEGNYAIRNYETAADGCCEFD